MDNKGCRLCLSTEDKRSFYPLVNNEFFQHLKASLALMTDLGDTTIQPSFICDECDDLTKRFINLKKLALENETILIKYQQQILETGLKNAIEIAKADCSKNHSLVKSEIEDCSENSCAYDTFDTEDFLEEHFSAFKKEESGENDDSDLKPTEKDLQFHDGSLDNDANVVLETCDVCGKTCATKKLLRSHMLVHTSQMVKCPKCIPDRFLKEYVLKRHLKNCHKEADVPCEFPGCEKKFKQKEVMQRHIKSVHMLERTLCSRCGEAVLNLSYHLETCNKDNLKNVTCKICNKQFSSKYILGMHERNIHGPGIVPEICSVCGKAVKDMKSHMKLNHSEKNQRTICCEVEGCAGKFRTNQEVRNHHNRVHLDLKSQCNICLQWFKNVPDHIKQVHEQGRKHVCSQVSIKSNNISIFINNPIQSSVDKHFSKVLT